MYHYVVATGNAVGVVQESKRDDGRLILTAAAVVLLPAIAILAFAYLSGYLDTLNDSYTTY